MFKYIFIDFNFSSNFSVLFMKRNNNNNVYLSLTFQKTSLNLSNPLKSYLTQYCYYKTTIYSRARKIIDYVSEIRWDYHLYCDAQMRNPPVKSGGGEGGGDFCCLHIQ